jgi:hypothetical protein
MKKQFYTTGILSLLFCLGTLAVFGQASRLPGYSSGPRLKQKFANQPTYVTNSQTGPGNSVQGLWDVRFVWDPVELSGYNQHAGVVYARGFFYTSKWNGTDTLFVFDSTGAFVQVLRIPSIGAVRSLTYDGQFIYASNNTRNIQVINPVTRTRVRQFAVPTSVGNVRWITYNPQGSNGAGSFFCGNWDTPIFQVNKPTGTTATLINNIPAATHGLTGMYGVAYEANGANSVFWAFDQGQDASAAVVVQLNATGVPTGVTHDVDPDCINPPGSAGGIFLGDVPGYSGKTLVCLNQGAGLVGYDISPPAFDAAIDSLSNSFSYAAWPKNSGLSVTYGGRVKSVGTTTLANFSPTVTVTDLDAEELVQTLQVPTQTLGPGQSGLFTTAPILNGLYTPGALMMVDGITNYPGDQNGSNDTLSSFFMLSDSTYARDYSYFDNSIAGSIGIGAGASSEGALGTKFTLINADTLTSVSYYLSSPFEGQPSSVSIYSVTNGVIGTTPITTTNVYTATAADEANGVLVTLPLDNPLPIAPGEFFVAVNELGDSTVGIGNFPEIYKTNTYFVKFAGLGGGAWTDLQTFGATLRRPFAIYPNFGKIPAPVALAVCTTSTSVVNVTQTSATVNNSVLSDGGSPVTERGVCWNTSPNPTIALTTKTSDGSGTGNFSSNVSGLTAGTMYYLRAYATTANGTAYGNEIFFTTQSAASIATLSTDPITNNTTGVSATSGGNISADGGAPITARGVCWSTTQNPTINLPTKTFNGTGTGAFVSQITGLTVGTTYYVRSYAQNAAGVAYGDEVSFVAQAVSVSKILAKGDLLNMALFPNPAKEMVNASLYSEKGGRIQISLRNALGQLVYQNDSQIPAGEVSIPVSIQNLKAGLYFYSVSMDGQVKTQTLVKE